MLQSFFHISVAISTHIIGIFFLVKGKSIGENIIVAVVWTAVVEDTLGWYPLPEVEQINLSLPPQIFSHHFGLEVDMTNGLMPSR